MKVPTYNGSRAFNLIESTIVLAIIGLVIGGIWFASASINEERRVSELRAAVVGIHSRTLPLFSTSNVSVGNTILAQNAQQSGIMLSDWAYQSSGYFINRSGDQIQLVVTGTPCTGLTGAILAVRVITTRSVCTKLVSGMGGPRSNVGAFYWTTQNTCQLVNTTPLTLAQAQTRCAANTGFSLQMPLGSSN